MHRIFVEGKDKDFLEYLIGHYMNTVSAYEIISVGGKNNLHSVANKFRENTDNGGINLIIFDADSPENQGGYERNYAEIQDVVNQLGISVNGVFLFPDNSSDGDLESLLEGLVPAEKKGILTCFGEFESCLRQLPIAELIRFPNRKRKMFLYKDVLVEKGDKTFAFENSNIWNFESPVLENLKTFLRQYFEP